MRGHFNTTCDLYEGPGTSNPGALRQANLPCRIVADPRIVAQGKWFNKQTHWLTCSAIQPIGAVITHTAPHYKIDCTLADRIAFPAGGGITHAVLWVERITPTEGTPYWRAHIFALPDPDGEY